MSFNIIRAIDGPFATWLGDPSDWAAWRVVHKAMACLPLDEPEFALFQRCTGRSKPFDRPVTEAWFAVGRRGRKTATAATVGVHMAVHHNWSKVIAPGETARVLIVATTKDQASLVKHYALALLQSQPDLASLIAADDIDSITLTTGIEIVAVANSFRSIRGPAVVCAIFDEVAFWRDAESATPDKEVLRAVRPSMATVPGSVLIGISSVYARKGLLYEKHRDNFGRDDSRVMFWLADTRTMNPKVEQAIIDEAMADDPASANAEYFSVWRDDIASFLDSAMIERQARSEPLELPPVAGVTYQAFIDPSGGAAGGDEMTLAIGHRDGACVVIDAVVAIAGPFIPSAAVDRCCALLATYRVREVTGDHYAAAWVKSMFEQRGITYRTSELPKSSIYLESLPVFTQGRIELPPDRVLLSQLAQLERRTSRSGKDSVDHGVAGHDDRANAVCGVAWMLDRADSSAASVARVTAAFGHALAQNRDPDARSNWLPPGGAGSSVGYGLGPNSSVGISLIARDRDPEFGRW
jgi:hypothetical protein